MSSVIFSMLICVMLAVLCIFNVIRCNNQMQKLKRQGEILTAEIVSFQQRREPTSTSIRHTNITWYDIKVKVSLPDNTAVTHTIRTTSFAARKYRNKTQTEIIAVLKGKNPYVIDEVFINEDRKGSPELILSLILFIAFSLAAILNIAELIIRIKG